MDKNNAEVTSSPSVYRGSTPERGEGVEFGSTEKNSSVSLAAATSSINRGGVGDTPPAKNGAIDSHSNLPAQKSRRRELRSHLTPAEATLWRLLKGDRLAGLRWRRQFGVDAYILDFYCPALRLAIELDGEVHNTPEACEYDERRTRHLEKLGIRVLRFENRTVFENAEGICREVERVQREVDAAGKPTAEVTNSPSVYRGSTPERGEGVEFENTKTQLPRPENSLPPTGYSLYEQRERSTPSINRGGVGDTPPPATPVATPNRARAAPATTVATPTGAHADPATTVADTNRTPADPATTVATTN